MVGFKLSSVPTAVRVTPQKNVCGGFSFKLFQMKKVPEESRGRRLITTCRGLDSENELGFLRPMACGGGACA